MDTLSKIGTNKKLRTDTRGEVQDLESYPPNIYVCKHCSKKVDELFGLFVPHACKECMNKIRNKCIEDKDICSLCGQPRCDCCC